MELMTRRFGTAKRLDKIMNTEKCYFSWEIFDNLELLIHMKYHMSFGSAKPTRGVLWSFPSIGADMKNLNNRWVSKPTLHTSKKFDRAVFNLLNQREEMSQ